MEWTAGGPDRRAVGSQIGGIESDQRRTAPVPCVYRGMWEKEGMKQFSKIALIAIFAAFFVFFGLSGGRALAYRTGPDPGYTGAPGELDCTACHFSGPAPTGQFSITGLPANYTPNAEIPLTVTLTQGGRAAFGFQATAIDDAGNAAGSVILTEPARTQLITSGISGNQRFYVEHTTGGANPTGSGTGSWTFKWQAPAASVGRVRFFVAGNAANNDNTQLGDAIYTTSASTQPAATPTPTPIALVTVSAASFQAKPVTPNSIVAGFAQNGLASGTATATGLPLPETLLDTQVRVTDSGNTERVAALFFVSPAQVNFEIPGDSATGTATVRVVRGNQPIAQGTVQIEAVSPGIFLATPSAGNTLAAALVFRVRGDGSSGFEGIVRFDQATNQFVPIPIDLGPSTDQVFLILYGTGFRFRSALSAVTATIGGVSAPVSYAGPSPPFVGLDQANISISPTLAGRGTVNVVFTADGKEANTVVIGIK